MSDAILLGRDDDGIDPWRWFRHLLDDVLGEKRFEFLFEKRHQWLGNGAMTSHCCWHGVVCDMKVARWSLHGRLRRRRLGT